MWKLTDYISIAALIVFGVFFAVLSYEMDKRDDAKLAAMLKPINNSDLAWLK